MAKKRKLKKKIKKLEEALRKSQKHIVFTIKDEVTHRMHNIGVTPNGTQTNYSTYAIVEENDKPVRYVFDYTITKERIY